MSDQRRRIAALEETVVQKTKEFERALASEETKHRAEIRDLLSSRNPHEDQQRQQQAMWQRSASIGSIRADASTVDESKKRENRNEQVPRDNTILSRMAVVADFLGCMTGSETSPARRSTAELKRRRDRAHSTACAWFISPLLAALPKRSHVVDTLSFRVCCVR